jgi:16S rRNA (cytidine1402-2'-O)-methyltransferase
LVPTLLGAAALAASVPDGVQARIRTLGAFIAESAKGARAFLKAVGYPSPMAQTPIEELNEHTPPAHLPALLQPLRAGLDVGLLSEAGCPAIADPGAALVALAHQEAIRVVPLVGPSALLLALMASGLDGQRFCFHGYLPVEHAARLHAIRELESQSRGGHGAQLVIETPYRSERLLQAFLEGCQPATRLCIAADLTLEGETIRTLAIAQWRGQRFELARRPAVFILQAATG